MSMLLVLAFAPAVSAVVSADDDGGGAAATACDDQGPDTCCPGKYWSKLLSECLVCQPGHFSTSSKESCDNCPAGQYQDEHAQTECKSCAGLGYPDRLSIKCEVCNYFEHSPADGSGEGCESCFASAAYMFGGDFCLVETMGSLVLLACIVSCGFYFALQLIRRMQGRADSRKADSESARLLSDDA